MGTRSFISFKDEGKDAPIMATFYKHYDGYPSGIKAFTDSFFQAVEEHTQDTRFDDVSYLAAKMPVFHAIEQHKLNQESRFRKDEGLLGFLGMGVVPTDAKPGVDIEYVYEVVCNYEGRPKVYMVGKNGKRVPIDEAVEQEY